MPTGSPYAALWSVLAHDQNHLLLIDWQDGSRRESSYFPAHDAARFESMLAYHVDRGTDPRVGLAPRKDRSVDNVAPSSVFWASVENPTSLRGLQAFAPKPTLLFRTGRVMRALWWLDRPLPMRASPSDDFLTKGNKRLAYALKANSRHADPAWLMPLGELVDADPSRVYDAFRVVGRLRDAPVRSFRPVAA